MSTIWKRATIVVVATAITAGLFASIAHAINIQAVTANRGAQLGSPYDAEKESILGGACVQGTAIPAGVQQSTFSFENAMSLHQASEQLGFAAGGRARFGVTQVSASARFMKNSVSSKYSVSAIWSSEYTLPSEKLSSDITRTAIGNAAATGAWRDNCGNEYVDEIVRGARLFFSIRVDFSSSEQRQEFEAKFSLSGPLASANASLQKASAQLSKDVKVTVSAFQLGGDVSKLTGVLGGSDDAVAGFVQCTLGNFDACAKVIGRALQYATDLQNGFPSQISPGVTPGPAPIIYRTSRYPAGNPQPNPILDAANERARVQLHTMFEKHFDLQTLIERLLSLALSTDKLDRMNKQKALVEANLAAIIAASKICYDTPDNCHQTVRGLSLSKIDESVLDLPPLPKASFRLLTTGRGLWNRNDSVAYFMNENGTPRSPAPMLIQLGRQEAASIVLRVESDSLKEATLYFENQRLGVTPLTRSVSSFAEKFGTNYVLLVLETTRANPGWRDIDLGKARADTIRALQQAAENSDGTFYLMIADEYGRTVRVDLQYERFSAVQTAGSPGFRRIAVRYRNRWWDTKSDGVSLAGEGNWSAAGSLRVTASPF